MRRYGMLGELHPPRPLRVRPSQRGLFTKFGGHCERAVRRQPPVRMAELCGASPVTGHVASAIPFTHARSVRAPRWKLL